MVPARKHEQPKTELEWLAAEKETNRDESSGPSFIGYSTAMHRRTPDVSAFEMVGQVLVT